mgnify:FL=1
MYKVAIVFKDKGRAPLPIDGVEDVLWDTDTDQIQVVAGTNKVVLSKSDVLYTYLVKVEEVAEAVEAVEVSE